MTTHQTHQQARQQRGATTRRLTQDRCYFGTSPATPKSDPSSIHIVSSNSKMSRPKKRQRQQPATTTTPRFSKSKTCLLLSTAMALTLQTHPTFAQDPQPQTSAPKTFDECTTFLAISDDDRDLRLDQREYGTFINFMSDWYFLDLPFEQLPAEVTSNFFFWAGTDGFLEIEGSYPGSTPTQSQIDRLINICFDSVSILNGILTAAPTYIESEAPTPAPFLQEDRVQPVDVTFETCRTDMALSDTNLDSIMDAEEYLDFISNMSLQQLFYSNYTSLPELLSFNFVLLSTVDSLSGDRTIDISGSQPGDTVDAQQSAFLEKICHQTQNAINSLMLFGTPQAERPTTSIAATPLPTVAPSKAPVFPPLNLPARTIRPLPPVTYAPTDAPVASSPPTNSYSQCRLAITAADTINRNDLIDENEYLTLVYRLSGRKSIFQYASFASMPANLQTNFYNLAAQGTNVGEINVYGAAPMQQPTAVEDAFLQLVCSATEQAMLNIPTLAPVSTPTASPTEDFSDCRRDLAWSDTQPRNNFLGRNEYVVFINRLTGGEYLRYTFYSLPKVLRDNFDALASVERPNPEQNGYGNAIYIYGSFLIQNANPTQVEFLRRICEDTDLALFEAANPETEAPVVTPNPTTRPPTTSAPTIAPVTMAPNLPPVVETPNPTTARPRVTPRPTPEPTPAPTLRPFTPRPTPNFNQGLFTPAPTEFVRPPSSLVDEEEEQPYDVRALIGACVFAIFVVIVCVAVGKRVYKSMSNGKDPNKVSGDDEDFPDEETGMPNMDDETDGFNINVMSPAPSGILGSSEGSESDEKEEDEEMGESGSKGPSKEFGQFGGPDLPIDFGMDLENVSTSDDDSSGSEEERPSDVLSYEDDEDDEDDEGERTDDFFGDSGDDGGNFFAGGGGGWGTGTSGEDEEEESEEESRSGSGSYEEGEEGEEEEEGEGSYESGESGEDRTRDEYTEDEDSRSRSEEDEEGSEYSEDEESQGEEESMYESPEGEEEEEEEEERSSSGEGEEEDAGADGFDAGFGGDGFGGFDSAAFGGNGFGGGQENLFAAENTGRQQSEDLFEEDNDEEESSSRSGSGSGSSELDATASVSKASARMDAAIESGDWEGVAASVKSFEHDDEESESDDESTNSEEIEKRAEYRAQVEGLVARVIPDEIGNVADMLEQFKGREEDLITTLTQMEERSLQQDTTAPPPSSDSASGSYSASNSLSGSTPSGGGSFASPGRADEYGDEGSYVPSIPEGEEGEEDSQYSPRDEGGSYEEEPDSPSQYSEQMTEYDEEGSPYRDRFDGDEQSEYSREEGEAPPQDDDEVSLDAASIFEQGSEEGSYSGEEDEGSRSYYSGEEEGSYSGEEGSYEGESQYSGEEGSYAEGESQYSGEEGESQYSREEGSYAEGESQYSGDEGSYREGESQYSGEEGSYSGEGSRSYHSGEEEGSYSGSGSYDEE